MTEPSQSYRRQQRRRAIIAWTTAVLAVGLIVLGAIVGGDEKEEVVVVYPTGYEMSAAQYEGLETGLDEGEFLERLEQTGSPENRTPENLVALFPPHEEDLSCSYWQISDQRGTLARICFDEDGELVEKLERNVFDEPSGVTA